MAKRKRRPPVVWGYQDGRTIVTHAAAKWARDLPAVRLHGLGETIQEMGGIVDAFAIAAGLPDDRSQKIMMRLTVRVAVDLMQDAAEDWRAVLALSPTLREIVGRVEANLKKPGATVGGAA